MTPVSRAEVCVAACADAWRGDGEILASPFGTIPSIGARLARATFAPDLLLTDGEATLVSGLWPVGGAPDPEAREAILSFRAVIELSWTGRRHAMMAPSQLDRYGNSNISCIGDFKQPKVQLLGVRGAPSNTVHHPTSYWVPRHSPRAFVERVDMVSGVGYDSARAAGPSAERFLDLRRVVTNLAVFDFGGPDHHIRLVSVHPGVAVDEVLEQTGFELEIGSDVPESRLPTDHELKLIRDVLDPQGLREREVPTPIAKAASQEASTR